MEQYLAYITWVLAAFCNSVMDRTENAPAYNQSVFKNLEKKFWLKEVSWQYAVKILKWKGDCWHIAKSMMVIFIAATIVFSVIYEPLLRPWLNFIVLGLLWNGIFNLFYNYILKRK